MLRGETLNSTVSRLSCGATAELQTETAVGPSEDGGPIVLSGCRGVVKEAGLGVGVLGWGGVTPCEGNDARRPLDKCLVLLWKYKIIEILMKKDRVTAR